MFQFNKDASAIKVVISKSQDRNSFFFYEPIHTRGKLVCFVCWILRAHRAVKKNKTWKYME